MLPAPHGTRGCQHVSQRFAMWMPGHAGNPQDTNQPCHECSPDVVVHRKASMAPKAFWGRFAHLTTHSHLDVEPLWIAGQG